MEIKTISLRRRYLMVAGLAGVAASAAVFAMTGSPQDGLAAEAGPGSLVISGRILGDGGQPLAGATVELWTDGSREAGGRTSTDADGRFFAAVAPESRGRPRDIRYRLSHRGRATPVTRLDFARSDLQRDEAGTWRATFGASLA